MSFLKSIGKAIGSVASPLVSGAFGIGSAILGNKAQKDANETNIKIAQLNNEWSEKMMEKQNAFNIAQWEREKQYETDMWNKTNEYNSASQQAQRFKEAGLNPALMMGSGNAGSASSVSAPSGNSVGMPSPTSAQVQPLRYEGFANAINNVVQQSMAISRNNAEIESLNKNTDAQVALARAKIAELYEETRSKELRNNLNDITRDLQISHMNEDFLRKVQERTNMEEQQKLIQQQVVAQQLINQNLPDKLAMEVAVMISQRDLNKFNADHELGKVISSIEKRGHKLSPYEKKIIFESLKQYIAYAPTRNMSSSGVAATIGNVIGNAIK